jgi:hypothetical protein
MFMRFVGGGIGHKVLRDLIKDDNKAEEGSGDVEMGDDESSATPTDEPQSQEQDSDNEGGIEDDYGYENGTDDEDEDADGQGIFHEEDGDVIDPEDGENGGADDIDMMDGYEDF